MMTQEERRVTFPEDIMVAANKYADVERERMKKNGAGELILKMITGKSIIQQIVMNDVKSRGYWKPATKAQSEPEPAA